MFLPAGRVPGRGVASALALAAALAAGGALGTAATVSPALAQGQAKANYSPDFVKVYQPVANIVNAADGDFAAAKAQAPAVVAAAQSADDRNAAGSLLVTLGGKLNDRAMQRQGLELMLASGKVAPAQVGQLQFVLGNLAADAKDWAAARTALQAAKQAGYADENMDPLLAESYFNGNQAAEGLAFLKTAIEQRAAAGQPVPETWLRRGLAVAYENKLAPQATEWSALLAKTSPSATNWQMALQVVGAVNNFDTQVQLDLLRLMAITNSMKERAEFVRYVEAADPRIMANEVSRVLEGAVQAGVLTTGDEYYKEVKRVVDERAPADRSEAPKLVAEAKSAANGSDALNAGDVLYSLGQYAQAEEMYQLALQKGGVDKDRALTRLGIAQAHQGKNADAKSNFAQVSGARAPVAQMWQAYVESKA